MTLMRQPGTWFGFAFILLGALVSTGAIHGEAACVASAFQTAFGWLAIRVGVDFETSSRGQLMQQQNVSVTLPPKQGGG